MQNIKKILLLISFGIITALLTACSGGGSSSSITITPINNSIKAPANLTASNTNTGNDGSIRLNWDSVGDLKYRVHQVSVALSDNSTLSNFTTLTSYTSYDVNSGITVKEILGLTHGTTYYFAVTSVSGDTHSLPSNIVSSQPSLSAPTDLNATSVGDAQASLSWTGINHSSANYTLHYATAAFTNIEPSAYANLAGYSSRSVAVTTATITELANSVEHFVVVTAVVNGQHSVASSQINFTPILTAPSNLSGISNNEAVSLTWDGVADATYKVYYSTSTLENKTPAELKATDITVMDNDTANSANVNELANGTAYYFVVTAVKAGVESLPSSQFSVAPGATIPSNLAVGTATENNQAIKLTWGGIGSASAYTVHQATASFGSNPTAASLSNAAGYTSQTAETNTQLELTNLANGTTYYFVVTAITDNGESTPSNQVSALPNIAVPQNLTAETSEGQAKLSWETVAGASYVIHQATAAFIGFATLSSATDYISHAVVVGSSKTTIDLINGKTYHFVINAVRNDQHSAVSNSATASPVLPAPAGLSATAGISQASLSWNEVAGATYKVYYATTDLTNHTSATALQALAAVQITAANTNTATIRGLTNERNYYFKVTALKAGVESVPSAQANALPTFPAPTGLSATAGISQASLSWNEVAGATYKVYYATTDLTNHTSATALQALAAVQITAANTNTATIRGLTNERNYYFKVTALKAGVESVPSAQASAFPTFPAPINLAATTGAGTVSLNWTAPATVSTLSYTVHRATVTFDGISFSNYSTLADYGSNDASTNSTTITGLSNGTLYYFIVTAVKDGVQSAPTNVASATVPRSPAPTGLVAEPNLRQVTLSWNALSTASYNVYYGEQSFANLDSISNYNTVNGAMLAVDSTTGSTVTHSIINLTNDTTYYFVITAVIGSAESLASTQITAVPRLVQITGHTDWVNKVAFSPDGELIASASDDGSVRIWNSTSGVQIHQLNGHSGDADAVVFSTDSKYILSGGGSNQIFLWDVSLGTKIATLIDTGKSRVSSLVFNASGTQFVSASNEGDAHLWTFDGANSTIIRTFSDSGIVGGLNLFGVDLSPDGTHLRLGDLGGNVFQWSTTSGVRISSFRLPADDDGYYPATESIAYSPSGASFIVAEYLNDFASNVLIYNSTSNALVHTLSGHTDAVSKVVYTADGKHIISGSLDNTIKIWDALAGGVPLETLTRHTKEVFSVAISPDGKRIVSGSRDHTIRVWEPEVLQD